MPRWTEAQVLRLERAWSSNEPIEQVAHELGRSVPAVWAYAHWRGFGPRVPGTVSLLEASRQLGYCRDTIKRVIYKLGFHNANHHPKGKRWRLTDVQLEQCARVLEGTRTARR